MRITKRRAFVGILSVAAIAGFLVPISIGYANRGHLSSSEGLQMLAADAKTAQIALPGRLISAKMLPASDTSSDRMRTYEVTSEEPPVIEGVTVIKNSDPEYPSDCALVKHLAAIADIQEMSHLDGGKGGQFYNVTVAKTAKNYCWVFQIRKEPF